MKHLRLWIIALLLLVVIQGVALASLWLLAGQSISNSVLVNETFFGGPFRFIKKMEVVLNPFFRGEKPETHMPHYVLHIEADEYQEVVNALPTETSSRWYGNILTLERENRPWVNGTFYADGEEYDVKVRIRGDLRNHWGDTKKSWRVKFPREQNFNGMREVNFIIPEDRKWFAEPLNVHRAKKFGLVQPHMQFATISLNNSEPLVYLEVEHWGKEMLEKQGIPGDINFYNVGAGSSQYNFWDDPSEIAYWDKYEQYPSTLNSVEDLDTLLQLLEEEDSESLLPKLEALFDIEMLIHWYVHALLTGSISIHAGGDNVRIAFDSSRGIFIPIPWDLLQYPITSLDEEPEDFLKFVARVPELQERALHILWEYVEDEQQRNDDLQFVQNTRNMIERPIYRDSYKAISNVQVYREMNHYEQLVPRNFDFLQKELSKMFTNDL